MSVGAIAQCTKMVTRAAAARTLSATDQKVHLVGSRIIEVSSFASFVEMLDEDTLFCVDYDLTTARTPKLLGSDPWCRHRIKLYEKNLPKDEALDHGLTDWFTIQNVTKAIPVEETTPAIIRSWQDQGRMVMGLTTRSASLSLPTSRQLKSMGIDFSRTAPQLGETIFLNPHTVKFFKGVLYTSGTNKGESLDMFFNLTKDVFPRSRFKSIAFLNDRLDDLVDLKKKADSWGIPYLGGRYSYTDEMYKNPDLAGADKEFDELVALVNK